jgi:DNA (cytosine-5)-methyltransferase 1
MKKKIHKKQIIGIDLFCGVGGLTHGLIRGKIIINVGIDIDKNCRFPYEKNNKAVFLQQDVGQLESGQLRNLYPKNAIRLLAGCAPCQPYSTYSRGKRHDSDGRWNLLNDFGRLVKEVQPELVTMENVPQIIDHPVFKSFLQNLEGYNVWYSIIDCTEYGVPQTRKRLVLLASKLGSISLIAPTHKSRVSTVRDVIYDLPRISAGGVDPNDSLHKAPNLSEINLKRIRASKPGGTWRDWSAELRASCHRKQSGVTYPSVYGRMEWDSPSPTITTQCYGFGNGRFGHPEQDRAISLREAALIQTFPKGYQFTPSNERVSFDALGRLIGNAVPVRLGEVIAESLNLHIRQV